MPTPTTRFNIPKPADGDVVTDSSVGGSGGLGAAFDSIDAQMAGQAQVDQPWFTSPAAITWDAGNNWFVVTLGPGRASFNSVIVVTTAPTTIHVPWPGLLAAATIFVNASGVLYSRAVAHNARVAGEIPLWQMTMGGTPGTYTLYDLRAQIDGEGLAAQDALAAHEASNPATHAAGSILNSNLATGIDGSKLAAASVPPGRLITASVGPSAKVALNYVPTDPSTAHTAIGSPVLNAITPTPALTGVPATAVDVTFHVLFNLSVIGSPPATHVCGIAMYGWNGSAWVFAGVATRAVSSFATGAVPVADGLSLSGRATLDGTQRLAYQIFAAIGDASWTSATVYVDGYTEPWN